VPSSFKRRADENLTDAMFYRGGVVLLADRDRYPTGTYDGDGDGVTENHPNPGPIVPLLGALAGEHLFDDGFEFDGLDEPTGAFPSIPVPAGYGNYCSVRDPQSGGFGLLPQGAGSDPCQDFLNTNPNLIIDRAGLWSLNGTNYVMGSCGYGAIWIRGGTGATPINQVFNDAAGQTNCTFTIAPASLPVFARPYSGAHPSYSQPFDHDPFRIPLDVTQFGQTPRPGQPLALTIDLWGLQQSDAANVYLNGIDEPATDIVIPNGRQNLSVAAGRVAFVGPRYVLQCCTPFGGDPYQREVWIRHRVGSGRYAEEFVTFYAHSKSTQVKRGDVVSAGTVLGDTGQSGGASGFHLHFATYRMRNLAWRKTYDMDWSLTNFTLNKEIAAMDAWGWRAPLNLDPWGWRFHGHDAPRTNPWGSGTMYDAGTWDIDLWLPGEDAPMPQLP
jgi:murein DD-endopeptidase MepM/ murein hydrolase activator NlpD